jgi:hypothetical protein
MRLSSPRRIELGAKRYDEQHWKSFNLVYSPAEHFEACRIDPMRIFDDHQRRSLMRQSRKLFRQSRLRSLPPFRRG